MAEICLDVAPISEIIEVVDAGTFVRPIYAGNALETIHSDDAKKVITVRPTVFKAAADGGSGNTWPVVRVATWVPWIRIGIAISWKPR